MTRSNPATRSCGWSSRGPGGSASGGSGPKWGVAALLVFACVLPAVAAGGDRNLVPNGNFDEGAGKATKIPGWTEVDGLTTFFVGSEGRRRVLMIDTDVNLVEADARWEEMARPKAERPAAKPKGPTKPPKYDTVGGTTGAKVYSDYIRVEPGMRYRLSAWVKSTGTTVMIFVKGYAQHEGGFRKFYQCYENVVFEEPGWHRHERTFNPTAKSPKVTHIRVMPYAYWPAGQAWIDGIEVTRVGPEKRPGAVTGKSLLENGDFEAKEISPWTAEGEAGRFVRGGEGACGRVGAGGSLVSGRVAVLAGKEYVAKARVLPAGAVLEMTVEGLVRFGGKDVPFFVVKKSAPPKADGWVDLEIPFHPTAETPQVSHVRVRLSVAKGSAGSAFVDDVAVEPKE